MSVEPKHMNLNQLKNRKKRGCTEVVLPALHLVQ